MIARGAWARASLISIVGLTVFSAGCLGGRRGATATPADAAADSVARADSVAPDSASLDSILRAARDSAARDSISDSARVVSLRDSTARDSMARDSVSRADSTARRPPARRRSSRECVLDFSESPPESRLLSSLVGEGVRNTYIGGGVVARCQGDQQVIRADSAEQYENAGLLNLYGNVVFDDPGKLRVTSMTASYFTGEEKLVAYENVVATDIPTGSTFTGPMIEYYRATAARPESRLYAPQRPTLNLVERDSTGATGPPVIISANQFEARGDTGIVGWGSVQINREFIQAEADSASFDKFTERARLIRNAFIFSRDSVQPFRLVGDSIDLFSTNRVLERIVAIHRAQATSNDVVMRAERVEMTLDSQKVNRAWAFGAGRSYVETTQQSLEADSMEILMPAQVLRQVNAVGKALAFGTPDTLRISNPERDVLVGDTIIAEFDTSTVAPDTSPSSIIRQVTAILEASAKYQLPSNRGRFCPPAINYVRGQRVVVAFDSGTVQTVTVDSQASGVYLEPLIEPARDSSDSTATVCGAPVDTTTPDSLRRDSVPPSTVPPNTVPPVQPPVLPSSAQSLSEPLSVPLAVPPRPPPASSAVPRTRADKAPARWWLAFTPATSWLPRWTPPDHYLAR